jgi:hypothetical protein
VQFDANRVGWHLGPGAGRNEYELAVRMRRIVTPVDVGDDLAPLIKDLRGVIAALHLRHLKQNRSLFVHGNPRFEIGDVEVRIDEIRRPDWIIFDDVVGDPSLLEVGLLLPDYKRAAKQINVGVGHSLLVGSVIRLGERAKGRAQRRQKDNNQNCDFGHHYFLQLRTVYHLANWTGGVL